MKIAICEDDKEQQQFIESLLKENKKYNDIEIRLFDSGEELIDAYQSGQVFSIIFLDMQMKELNGIETGQYLRKYDKKAIIIIITSILEYAMDGYSINAFEFILKPIDREKFDKILERAFKKVKDYTQKVYIVQAKDRVKVVRLSDIIYFESIGKKVDIHSIEGVESSNESISVVEKQFVLDGFIRISRFYLLNMRYIKEIQVDNILLKDGERLKYSEKLQKSIKEGYMNFMLGEI